MPAHVKQISPVMIAATPITGLFDLNEVTSGGGLPTLDLNLATGVLDNRIAFTRASTSTFTNSAGVPATAASGAARLVYDPASLASLGYLAESAATNLLIHSNFASGWTFTSASFTQSATTGPDGVASSAVKLVEVAATAQHFATIAAITITAGATCTGSVWLKSAERTTATIRLADGAISTGCSALVNLATGAVTSSAAVGTGTIVSATATPYANGWTRFTVTGTIDPATSTTARMVIFLQTGASYAGDGTSGCYCFGAQFEQSALATAYIATTTVTNTRLVDAATMAISAANISAAPTGLTLIGKFTVPATFDTATGYHVFQIDDGTLNNRLVFRCGASATSPLQMISVTGGSINFTLTAQASIPGASVVRFWVAFSPGAHACQVVGQTKQTSSNATALPTGLTTIRIAEQISVQQLCGPLSRLQIYNSRLTDAQAATIATAL